MCSQNNPFLNRHQVLDRAEIVISGISGRFPKSDNLQEFWQNLLNGVDMITEDDRRWTPGLNGLPTRAGKIQALDKFDASFFGVHPKQADSMDPQLRMLLEVTHEAIIDAGVNPVTIRGSKTGVFVGASNSECERVWAASSKTTGHGYALTGCHRAMFSNRISFTFDFQGPSFTVDTACSSSFIALEQAIASIRRGHCDAAIIAGSTIGLDPILCLQVQQLSMLSPDGMCKSFDASANGYVRSEAVGAIFIQKKYVALRSYASILAARTNSDGHNEKGVTFPSGQRQAQLLQETYREAGVEPKDVVYVEAHGTGTAAGDPQELNAIADVFCRSRDQERPLLIGSVKSNAGHAEAASGLLSIAKVLLSMQHGILPANLHYKTPNPHIPALCDGRLRVVVTNTPWDGGTVGLNSFGFGGANVHVILKSNPEENLRTTTIQISRVPYLIPFSGRTKDAVEFALTKITDELSSPDDLPQQLQRQRLLHEIARSETPRHTVRGHTLISSDLKQIHSDIQENTTVSGPQVWFIFNGMGSQWSQMGRHLLKFVVFEKSIEESAAILKPHGVDLMSILIDDDETALQNGMIKPFVAITSVQVALVDLLRSMGVIASGGIIGHSAGELAASYADECFTASQTVLAALARGRAITESMDANVEGAMAAVGLSWEEAQKKCPPGIYPACHNAKDSVTISGPKKDIEIFVQNLKNEGIFAKMVNSSKMAFHSKYIEPARGKLKLLMDEIIPVPRPRSARWISSSVPENEWNSPLAQFSSADYHVNNVLSPVLFQESVQKIPDGSTVIEIGPHALLQAILKRSLPKCTNIGLVNKNAPDNSVFLLQALGKLYNSGINLNLSTLYPRVEFPVTVDTPSISPLIKWDHFLSWDVPRIPEVDSNSGEIVMEISINAESDKFFADHVIDGRIIFPGTGYLFLIWKAFASLQKKDFDQVPIVLENVNFLRTTVLPVDGTAVKFLINIFKVTGEFQIIESDVVKVTGIVRSPNGNEFLPLDPPSDLNPCRIPLSTKDAYKELRLRSYDYSGSFQGIHVLDTENGTAKLKWQNNWVTFIDTFLQMTILHRDFRALYLPTHLDKAIFDPVVFLRGLQQQLDEEQEIEKESIISIVKEDAEEETKLVPVFFYPDLNVVTCEGIQLQRLKVGTVSKRSTTSHLLRLEKLEFTPYFDDSISSESLTASFESSLSVCLDIVLENTLDKTLQVLEILGTGNDPTDNSVISQLAKTHILNQPNKSCAGKVLVLAQGQSQEQRSKVTEALQIAGIQVTVATMENEAKLVREMSTSVDLVITDETQLLQNLNGTAISLRDQGILLHHKKRSMEIRFESESDFKALEDSCGLFLVAHKISPSRHFYLFKKNLQNFHDEQDTQSLIHTVEINLSPDLPPYSFSHFNYSWIEELKMAMQKAADMKDKSHFRIYLTSRESQAKSGQSVPSGVLGLVNSLRKEPGGDKIRCFFIRDSSEFTIDLNLNFLKPSNNLSIIIQRDLVMNVFEKNIWGSMRFYRLPEDVKMTRDVDHAYLNVITRGDLSSLRWFESDLKYHDPQSELCSVYYAPLNFRDVMLCTGNLAPDSLSNDLGTRECVLGVEWSGKTPGVARLMGVVRVCGLATSIVPDKEFMWNVPKTWSLAQAATVPVAYATAYYSLVVRGKIQRGESILIHSGAGGVGMATIIIALSMNCKVYTTVGSQEKRDFLTKTFPQLKDSSFANSRDSSFLEHILRETKGRGVDLVLNSLAGDLLQASIKCLAMKGRFLEIGKVDLVKNSSLGMSILLKNVSVQGILIASLKCGDPEKRQIQKLVDEGMNSGAVQPLNFTIFTDSVEDVEKAFRLMASGKHVGKILIEIRSENEDKPKNSVNSSKIVQALPRTHFDPKKCYIIIGGLGGFGLELCGWLIERGARKLALVSRSGVRNGYQYNCLRKWRNEGVTILTPTTDVTTLEGVNSLLNESMMKLGAPLGGIFNLAMILADGILQNQTAETFQTVSRPKINCTIFLDQVSRTLAPSLEYFVVFSSVVSGRGAPGLSNYAWANSGMERICENRQKDGLPGLAIMWGAVGDVGVLQDEKGMGNEAEVGGTVPQRISSCLNSLEILMLQSKFHRQPVLSSMVLAEKKRVSLKNGKKLSVENSSSLLDKIGHVLGMKPEAVSRVNPGMKLHEMGMDSLMSVEIKQMVEMTTGATMSNADMSELTFDKIHQLQSKMVHGESQTNDPDNSPSVEEIEREKEEYEQDEDVVHQYFSALSNLSDNPNSLSDSIKMLQTETGKETEHQDREQNNPATNSVMSSTDHELISSDLKLSASMTSFTSLTSAFSYFKSILTFLMIGFLLFLSILLRLGAKFYLKLFHDPNDLRLVSGPFDNICAASPRTANMIFNGRVFGVPSKSKIIKIVNERVINWKTNISFDSKLVDEYEPYESLRWKIQKGLFFYYWKRDRYFNVVDHVVFEKCARGAELENATLRASEVYHNFKWTTGRPKPQWEFRVISPNYPVNFPAAKKEFVIMFCMHHGYGDAISALHMVQYAWADSKPPKAFVPQLKPHTAIPESTNLLRSLRNLIAGAKYGISTGNVLIKDLSRRRRETSEHTPVCPVPDSKRHCGMAKYSLSQIKSVVTRDGASVPLNTVILTCTSKVYQRLYAAQRNPKKTKVPKSLMTWMPYASRAYAKLGLVNNFTHSYTRIPLSSGSVPSDDKGQEMSLIIQRNLEESSKPAILDASWINNWIMSHIPPPLDQLAQAILPSPHIVFTNVPATLPRHMTFFGGYKIKDFFGLTMFFRQTHASLASLVDSAADTVSLTLVVDDSALDICPLFVQRFLMLFQEELNHLVHSNRRNY